MIDWIARRAELSPSAPALYAGEKAIDFAAWHVRVGRMAAFLADRCDVRRGARVAILADSCVAYLDAVFACARLGAVAVNLNARLALPELAPLLRDGPPRVLLSDRDVDLGVPRVALGDAYADRLAAPVDVTAEDPWLVCFTGGSTGAPRGAVLTHGAVTANATGTIATWGLRPDDVAVLDAPLFHTGGLNVLTTPLVYAGGATIVRPRFDAEETLRLVDEGRVTLLFGVPTMLQRIVASPRWATADVSRLRLVVTGGAPAPRALFDAFAARGLVLRLGYGLTEAGPNNFWLPDDVARAKPGAVGWPMMHVEARLAEDGELLLRGPHVMAGVDGWLATGDLARRDEQGCWWIVGRKKEMFISGGENVYPAEVEAAICAHPAVACAAVVGVPHAEWGEVGLAAVVGGLREEELRAWLRGRLAGYKIPRRFVFVDELPRTTVGKIDRQAIVRSAR